MVGGTAADDVDAVDGADGLLVQGQLGKVDAAILQARRKRIADSGGLLVDLLHHEMLEAAFFGCFGVPLNGGSFVLNGLFVGVEKLNGIGRQARDLEIVNVIDGTGIFEQRGHVRSNQRAALGLADDERAVLAGSVDRAGFIGKQHAQRVRAAHMQHCAGDGVQRVAGGLAHIIVVQQLGQNLSVGLGRKGEALVGQALFDLEIVLDDAVVHDGNFFIVGVMGVCIDDRGLTVGGPAGVADAAAAGEGAAAVRHLAQYFQAALCLDDFDLACGVLHGKTSRVIAAVFQLGQAI